MKKSIVLLTSVLLVLAFLLASCDGTSEGLSVGDLAPDFDLLAADGNRIALSDYKGQPVLLFFHMAGG